MTFLVLNMKTLLLFYGSIIIVVASVGLFPVRTVKLVAFERQNQQQQALPAKNNQLNIGVHSIRRGKQFNFPDFSIVLDQYLPIEVNVPDTAMMFWHGAQMAWTDFNDYFNSDDQQMPSIDPMYI